MEKANDTIKLEEYINSKCPNCGSELKFLPSSTQTKCVSCDSIFEIDSIKEGYLDEEEVNFAETIEKLSKANISKEIVKNMHCENCGATININNHSVSTSCPYCGSHKVVNEDKEEEIIKITGVLPFNKNEQDVKNIFKDWVKNRFFAPNKFKKGLITPTFSGIYIPYYTFDSNTISSYSGYRGDYYYVTKTVKTKDGYKTVTERRVRWTYRRGVIEHFFDDVLIIGTNNPLNNLVAEASNFDLKNLQLYKEEFLLGYYCEKPSINLEGGFNLAQESMKQDIRVMCINEIGGDTYRDLKFTTNYSDVTFKQIMLPIYSGCYEYNNKNYNFIVNGQTGKFAGKCPISPLKVTLLVLFILLIVILIGVLLYYYS